MAQANEKAVFTMTFLSAASLATKQYYGVKLNNTDRTVALISAITDVPAGVLWNEPDAADREALVCALGLSPVELAETLVSGDLISFDANGKAIKFEPGSDTTAYGAGQITIGGDSGEVGEAMINCISPARGA